MGLGRGQAAGGRGIQTMKDLHNLEAGSSTAMQRREKRLGRVDLRGWEPRVANGALVCENVEARRHVKRFAGL